MNSLILALFLAAAAPAAPGEALVSEGGPVEPVLREAGLLGLWSQDCSQPVSEDNRTETISIGSDGMARTTEDGGSWTSIYFIVEAAIVDQRDTRMTLIHSDDGEIYQVVYRRDGQRQTTWESAESGGNVLIRDGRFTDDGKENPWFSRCPAE